MLSSEMAASWQLKLDKQVEINNQQASSRTFDLTCVYCELLREDRLWSRLGVFQGAKVWPYLYLPHLV